jgi:hypothetical protein
MARCAVRAAERRNELLKSCDLPQAFRPLLRGRGQRSAPSLPPSNANPGQRDLRMKNGVGIAVNGGRRAENRVWRSKIPVFRVPVMLIM